MPVRLSDLSPEARKQVRAQLGLTEPAPYEFVPLSEVDEKAYRELLAIRARISMVAARLTVGRVGWAIVALEAELAKLRVMNTNTQGQG